MAQFVTHIQPTLLEASQGHLPHHHAHQVGMQHSSHLPHSGHNMPSPPTGHNHHQHQHQYQQQEQSPHHQSPPSQMSSPPATGGHHYHHQHQHHSQELQQQQHQQHHHHHIQGKQTTGGTGRHEHCPSGHQSSHSPNGSL